jgi:hypothetical protein
VQSPPPPGTICSSTWGASLRCAMSRTRTPCPSVTTSSACPLATRVLYFEDSAPSASPDRLKAQAAPTRPRAAAVSGLEACRAPSSPPQAAPKLSLLPFSTTRRARALPRGVLPPRPLPRRRPLAVRLAERDARAQPAASRLQLAGALRLPLDVEVARVGGNSRLRHSTSHGWHARCGSLYRFDYRRLSAPACGSSGHQSLPTHACLCWRI